MCVDLSHGICHALLDTEALCELLQQPSQGVPRKEDRGLVHEDLQGVVMKSVKKGDSSADVKTLQGLLTAQGYPCAQDGVFGTGTEAAVLRYQRDRGLPADGIVGSNTWAALASGRIAPRKPPEPLPVVMQRVLQLGHQVMWKGDFHLNLFGIRSANAQAGSFDDTLGCAYTEGGLWRVHYWPGTTDPGSYYLADKSKWLNDKGVAILAEGQYVDAWKIGLHGGKYEALCQRGPVKVYRDADLDFNLDFDPSTLQESSTLGVNLHAPSSDPYNLSVARTEVGAWSAACQVHATTAGFRDMMDLARKQVDRLGLDTFTYTLMRQW